MTTRLHVVLHQPLYPSNIGAAARAMGNMGVERLVLIDPQCPVNSQAKRAAVGCQEILSGRTVYSNWSEFYQNEGEGLRIGFTARAGKLRPALAAETLFAELASEEEGAAAESKNIYLIFGREDFGLSADDVELLHHTCTLKTWGSYTSLNLAQAVLLALYVVRRHFPCVASSEPVAPEPIQYPEGVIQEWLETLGFDLSSPRVNALRVMNQLLLRNRPSKKELDVLQAILNQTVRKLKEGG